MIEIRGETRFRVGVRGSILLEFCLAFRVFFSFVGMFGRSVFSVYFLGGDIEV